MHALWILLSTGTAPAVEPVPDVEEPSSEAHRPTPTDHPTPTAENTAERPGGLLPDALEGTWWLVDDNRDQAIEDLVVEMPFYLRAMARTRLRAATFPCDAMHLEELGDRISVTCDDRLPAAVAPGQTVDYAPGVRVTMVVSGDSLVQTYSRNDGVRRNVFTARDDGMELEVTVRSPHLPRELVYQRSFTRDGQPKERPGVTEVEGPAAPPTVAAGS